MKIGLLAFVMLSLISIVGCSGIEPPSPGHLLQHPLGTTPLHIGMTKNEVKEIWGEPDLIQDKGENQDRGATEKQEWVYYGRMQNLPISYANLSKSLRIYFDGNSVTNFKEE